MKTVMIYIYSSPMMSPNQILYSAFHANFIVGVQNCLENLVIFIECWANFYQLQANHFTVAEVMTSPKKHPR